MSEEDQKLLKEAAVEAAIITRQRNDESAAMMESDLESQGMTIVHEDEVDNAAFREVASACYDNMESYIGSEWVEWLEKLVGIR